MLLTASDSFDMSILVFGFRNNRIRNKQKPKAKIAAITRNRSRKFGKERLRVANTRHNPKLPRIPQRGVWQSGLVKLCILFFRTSAITDGYPWRASCSGAKRPAGSVTRVAIRWIALFGLFDFKKRRESISFHDRVIGAKRINLAPPAFCYEDK